MKHARIFRMTCPVQRDIEINESKNIGIQGGISFNASHCEGITLDIDAKYVQQQLGEIAESEDLSRYIL